MQTKIFSLFSAALLIGGLAGCSSSDDVIDNTVPTAVSENAVGQAIDDVTAEMQSTIYNCAVSGTRAQSDIAAIEKEIPSWPEDLDTTVPSNAVDITGSNVNDWHPEAPKTNAPGGTWYVPANKTANIDLNMQDTRLYVLGTATITNTWNSNGKIFVLKGGNLIVNASGANILGGGGSIYIEKGGKLTVPDGATLNVDQNSKVYVEDGNISAKRIIVQGTLYVNGNLKAESFGDMTPNYTRLCVTGKMTSNNADLSTDGYIYIGDGIDAGEHAIIFKSGTKIIAQCGIKGKNITVNSNGVEVHANYINCDNLDQCASSTIFLKDTAFVDVSGTYMNENNGTAFIVMEGDNAVGVLRAKKIEFNGSGNSSELNDCYIFKTSGNQRLGIDCNTWNYRSGGDVSMSKIDFMNGTVEHISNGKVVDSVGNTPDGVKYSIPADECHGGGYAPGGGKDDNPQPVVVSEGHTHDISATCVQTDGKNVYVSYHKRGKGRSGCIEMLTTTGDITTLKQFVRDHDNAIDFNHIALDKTNKRLYAVGNNKNGGFLGFLRLKGDGTIDCAPQKGDLDSIEIAHKTYLPLKIAMLWEAQLASKKGGKGGDGNCVIVNGKYLDVASTYGYEVFDNTLAEVRATKTAGRAKHLAYAPDGNTFYAIHYDGTQIVDSMTEVGLKLEKFNKSDVMMQSPVFRRDANKVKPNNGKNAICVYDGKVYVCQSMNGLYVYDAKTGAQVGYYKENIKSSKTGQDLAICANGVAVDDKYVYVAYGTRGLVVLDRKTLKKVSRFMGQRSANYVALANGYIYVAYGRDSLKVFKMSK